MYASFDPDRMIEFCKHLKKHPELLNEYGQAKMDLYHANDLSCKLVTFTTEHLTDDGTFSRVSILLIPRTVRPKLSQLIKLAYPC